MGVYSKGNKYGIDEDLVYSFPVRCKNFEWEFANDFKLSEETKKLLKASEKELIQERLVSKK